MKNKPVLSTVISANPFSREYYSGTSTQIESIVKPKFQKNQYAVSYLKTSSFLSTKIEISKNIDEEDRHDVIENKTYEELGLDLATEYKIDYFELEYEEDESNLVYYVFAVDPIDLKENFAPIVDEIKYIDQVYPVPLLLKSLFTKEIITTSGVDCFIYFSGDDAFLTLYRDGEFLYTKALNYTIEGLHEAFCEIYGERVEYENFKTLLIEEGLRTTNEENREYLIKLFNEMFTQINDVLVFAKRAYEIEEINRVYIGSSLGVVYGIDEYFQMTLGIETLNFDFEYGFETKEFYVDQIHQLLHLTSQLKAEERYPCNFTLFNRPPPFIQRESGRLLSLAAAAIILTSIYPLFNVAYSLYADYENSSLKRSKLQKHEEREIRQQQVQLHAKKRDELKVKIKTALQTQKAQKQVLEQIHKQKVDYRMKATAIASLTQDLNAYNVRLISLKYDDKLKGAFSLEMVASKEKYITDMVEKLTMSKSSLFEFSLDEISFDGSVEYYTCNLKVGLR